MDEQPDGAEAQLEPKPGRRLWWVVATVTRWIGWWIATGLIALAVAVAIPKRPLTAAWLLREAAPFGVPGLLLAGLLWRLRRDRDGTVATVVLSVGFWTAVFVLNWLVLRDNVRGGS